MWLFISKRIRTWVLFSIAVPLVAKVVRSAAQRARASDPTSTTAKTLTRADSTLTKVSRRKARKNGSR